MCLKFSYKKSIIWCGVDSRYNRVGTFLCIFLEMYSSNSSKGDWFEWYQTIRHACIKNKLPFIGQHILDSRNKYKNIIKSHWHILIKIIQLIGTPQIWVNIYPSKIKTQETSLETEKMLCCMLWLKILVSDLCKTI